ncbi:MAG: glycosyltransferase family 2 protein [Anaerolineales bacterium]|nr:glycosyltransferase family 2 protein [Anaerolineales bacterium]
MFGSIIIPTIGRAALARAVESALAQASAEPFEIIVVNDGHLPLAPAAWQQARQVRVITTGGGRERSAARNAGAALAAGRYLNFLDDDDWLLPGALDTWAALARRSSAAWLYGAAQLSDDAGRVLFQFQHDLTGECLTPAMTGEWIPLQASAIAADKFRAVGGFDLSFHVAEDKDLLVRLCRLYPVAGTARPVAGILRGTWATSSDYSAMPAEVQRSRELILNQPGTFGRLWASAPTPYWRAKIARAYGISAVWNLRHGQGRRAVRRAAGAMLAGACARLDLLRPSYWRAFARHHLTPGFEPPSA